MLRFQEGPLDFLPTFRYVIGTNQYDKDWMPSWTDRILFCSSPLCKVSNTHYDRVELNLSDHKPVYGIYKTQIKIVDHGVVGKLAAELAKEFN